MDELLDLKQRLEQERPTPWAELPDLALYMDQIISYMPRQLIHFDDGEVLTSAMVNNYIKDGLVPRADGKRYGPIHLGYLTAVCALKRVLSVRDMKVLISAGEKREKPPEELYAYFLQALDRALNETAQSLPPQAAPEDLPRLALDLALRSYASQLACARILDILQPPCEEAPKKGKKVISSRSLRSGTAPVQISGGQSYVRLHHSHRLLRRPERRDGPGCGRAGTSPHFHHRRGRLPQLP